MYISRDHFLNHFFTAGSSQWMNRLFLCLASVFYLLYNTIELSNKLK